MILCKRIPDIGLQIRKGGGGMRTRTTERLVQCALFAALTAVCAQITIPIGPVPVSLSLLPVLLCGALLAPVDAAASMAVYLLLGLFGLPVFAGMQGGPGVLLGPTGGFIIGYIPCALLTALIALRGRSLPRTALAMACGTLSCYALGTVWYMVSVSQPLGAALSVCVLPFLPFDAAKIAIAALISRRVRKAEASSVH